MVLKPLLILAAACGMVLAAPSYGSTVITVGTLSVQPNYFAPPATISLSTTASGSYSGVTPPSALCITSGATDSKLHKYSGTCSSSSTFCPSACTSNGGACLPATGGSIACKVNIPCGFAYGQSAAWVNTTPVYSTGLNTSQAINSANSFYVSICNYGYSWQCNITNVTAPKATSSCVTSTNCGCVYTGVSSGSGGGGGTYCGGGPGTCQ